MISLITKQLLVENLGAEAVRKIGKNAVEMAEFYGKQCSVETGLDLFIECKNDGYYMNSDHMTDLILSRLKNKSQ